MQSYRKNAEPKVGWFKGVRLWLGGTSGTAATTKMIGALLSTAAIITITGNLFGFWAALSLTFSPLIFIWIYTCVEDIRKEIKKEKERLKQKLEIYK